MKILASILVLFFCCNLVFAQNCGTTECTYFGNLNDNDYKRELDKLDAVFYGEIVSQSEPIRPEKGFSYRILKVQVLRVWKGVKTSEVDVEFRYYDNDCLKAGESGKLIFYAVSPNHKSPFRMGWCNKYSFKDEKTKRILGEGKVIEKLQSQVEQLLLINKTPECFWSGLWQKIFSFSIKN
jgi:hypothetical protein